MTRKPKPLQVGEKLPKQLLVEGNDDFHVFCKLFEHFQLPADAFGIKEKVGYERIRDTLAEEVMASDRQALGIVVDADADLHTRWQSLRDRLVALGYAAAPMQPHASGTIINPVADSELPTVGLWLMPNNQLPGILENFIALLIPNHESNILWQHATQSVADIPGQKAFPDVRLPKAQLHTWLAWQEEPGKPIGQAIAARYLDAQTEAAERFVAWIKRLFQIS
ncbi:MAG: DUF3226 domain-containing protein [Gammaproteobacteria bacterium]